MNGEQIWKNENLIKLLIGGGIAVMSTDTLYGIVGSATDALVVEQIYIARKRAPTKPCIILISDIKELKKFSVDISKEQEKILLEEWTNPVSVILDCTSETFEYLHRGTKTLAVRLPTQEGLRNLLKITGPLIAPSANLEGMPPAQNIAQAKTYFGDLVDVYVDGGEIAGKASKVIKLAEDGSITVLRA